MHYKYYAIDPRPQSKEQNLEVFKENGSCFGIEMTIPDYKEYFEENVDPQHTHKMDISAIMWIYENIQDEDLPDDGSLLVTVRPDLDSIGSMALLEILRDYTLVNEDIYKRLKLIDESDRFAHGEWKKKPLPTKVEIGPLDAIGMASMDFKLPLEKRVELLKDFLLNGNIPQEYTNRVLVEKEQISAALSSGEIKIIDLGGYSYVESTHRSGTTIGYCFNPVVIAMNPEFTTGRGEKPHRKYSICQYQEGHIDLEKLLGVLQNIEPGWGGSSTFIGSPQAMPSKLEPDDIKGLVYAVIERK